MAEESKYVCVCWYSLTPPVDSSVEQICGACQFLSTQSEGSKINIQCFTYTCTNVPGNLIKEDPWILILNWIYLTKVTFKLWLQIPFCLDQLSHACIITIFNSSILELVTGDLKHIDLLTYSIPVIHVWS